MRAEILGVRVESALKRELAGRRRFWFLGAARIAATLLCGVAGVAIGFGYGGFWAAIPPVVFAGLIGGLLVVVGIVAWNVGRDKIRFQGERHFGCDWVYRASFEAQAIQS